MEEFGQLAGLYMNKNKSKILLKNIKKEEQEIIGKMLRCEVAQKIKHLGVELINKNIDLFKKQLREALEKIKEDLTK